MGLIDFIFPRECVLCHKFGKYFCDDCMEQVHVLNRFDVKDKIFSIFAYEGVIRKGIIKIKYNFAYDVCEELVDVLVKKIKLHGVRLEKCVLLPIPLHISRQRWRGFNQSEILGKIVASKMNWEFKSDVLLRNKQGKTQVGLKMGDRVRNIRGKFAVNSEAKLDQSRTYIIFDDVMTTGSTIHEVMRVFVEMGISNIWGLTIAR